MKKFVIASVASVALFIGCGDNKEAKELLERILQVVGIPYDMVVNICQDSNGNGICDIGKEVTAKIKITKGDTADSIWKKIQLDENGTYILEHYDPTKKILMEIEDNEELNNTKQKVTLPFTPKNPNEVPVQELSILQSLVDNNLTKEEQIERLKEDKEVRSLVDRKLLENIFENQRLLEEHNLSTQTAVIKNLAYIAEGLEDVNVSGEFIDNLKNCENNNSCQELYLEDLKEQTEITEEEAIIIAETNSTENTGDRSTVLTTEELNTTTKNVADGYIVKLANPAIAKCASSEYNSLNGVGRKGAIIFDGVVLSKDCNITIPKGATIDSNSNGELDSNDKIIDFEMKGSAEGSFISPLTTLALEKEINGEDVTEFKNLVKDFDPVSSINENNEQNKKLLLLMEVIKESLKSNQDIVKLKIPMDKILDGNISVADINVSDIVSDISSSASSVIAEKVNIKKSIIELFDDIDKDKVDLSSLFVNISDGGADIETAIENSKKENISDIKEIIRSDSNVTAIYNSLLSINAQLNSKTSFQKAIDTLTSLSEEDDFDDIKYKLDKAKAILKLSNPNEKDSQVGLALLDLAEITNNPDISSLLKISLEDGSLSSENLLNIIKGSLNDTLEVNINESVSDNDSITLTQSILSNTVEKLKNISDTLNITFSDPNYIFKYDDINITGEKSKLLRASVLTLASKLEYLSAFKFVNVDDIKTRTISDNNGDIYEYTKLDSNPVSVLNRSDVGVLDAPDRLVDSKKLLLNALSLVESVDINKIDNEFENEEDKEEARENQAEAIKVKNSLLGKDTYIGENLHGGLREKIDYNFSAIYNPKSAVELGSTLGHTFKYSSDDSYYTDGVIYIAGDYNETLSKYENRPVSNYWISKDGKTRLDASETYYYPELYPNPVNIPVKNNHILDTVKNIKILTEDNITRYNFNGQDILSYLFNEVEIADNGTHHNYYEKSEDVNLTYGIDYEEVVPYSQPPKYNLVVTYIPEWLDYKIINSNTKDVAIQITAKEGVEDYRYDCYSLRAEVNGKTEENEYCIELGSYSFSEEPY